MKITLKDGSVKEYASPMSIIDIAKDISEGLARVACLGEVDGEEEDPPACRFFTENVGTAKVVYYEYPRYL